MKYSRSDIAKGFVAQADVRGVKVAVRALAALLLEQQMHTRIDEIIADIAHEYARRDGIVEANVRTVFPLSSTLRENVVHEIQQQTGAKKVTLHEEIDRSLLGGVVITAPDMELDLSLKTKLTRLRV